MHPAVNKRKHLRGDSNLVHLMRLRDVCFWLQTERPQPETSQQLHTAAVAAIFFSLFIFDPPPSLAVQINTSRGRRDADAESLGAGKQEARFAARVKR